MAVVNFGFQHRKSTLDDTLSACFFCPSLEVKLTPSPHNFNRRRAFCNGCGAIGPEGDTDEQAAENWNRPALEVFKALTAQTAAAQAAPPSKHTAHACGEFWEALVYGCLKRPQLVGGQVLLATPTLGNTFDVYFYPAGSANPTAPFTVRFAQIHRASDVEEFAERILDQIEKRIVSPYTPQALKNAITQNKP